MRQQDKKIERDRRRTIEEVQQNLTENYEQDEIPIFGPRRAAGEVDIFDDTDADGVKKVHGSPNFVGRLTTQSQRHQEGFPFVSAPWWFAALVGSHSPEAEVFDLEIVLDTVFRAFAAHAALFDAAEGRDLGRDDPLVDADDAVVERFGDAPNAADVAGIEIGGETVFGIVRHRNGFLFRFKSEERSNRPEGLLARHLHLRRHI